MRKLLVQKNNSIPNLWKFILCIEILLWLPLILIGFDSHHDGLILTNVNLLNESFKSAGPWPFNQYGPFWILPYSFLTYFLPNDITLLALRVVTVGCYYLTSYFIYLAAKIIAGRKLAFIAVLVFFFSQPFLTNYGSNLVPWPSAIVMPITSLIFLLTLKIYAEFISKTKIFIISFSIGILISTVSFSRVQIGFLLLLANTLFGIFTRKNQSTFFIILGFISGSTAILFFLDWHGWVIDALNDQFIFGSTYLRGDTSSYPYPVFTFIATMFFLFLIVLAPKIKLLFSGRINFQLLMFINILIIFFILFWLSQSREISILNAFVILYRRFWMSLFLAIIIYSVFSQTRKTLTVIQKKEKLEKDLIIRNCLVIFSLVSEAQVFPLFDQMHFWWGSAPAVILVILISKDRLFNNHHNFIYLKHLHYSIIMLMTLALIPTISFFQESYSRYPKSIANFIYVSKDQSIYELNLQSYFSASIKKDSKVLNLCADSNVFFNMENNFKSASRNYVFWLSMYEVDSLYNAILSSKPNYIVTCSLNRIPALQEKSEALQSNILKKTFPTAIQISTFADKLDMIWRIYKLP